MPSTAKPFMHRSRKPETVAGGLADFLPGMVHVVRPIDVVEHQGTARVHERLDALGVVGSWHPPLVLAIDERAVEVVPSRSPVRVPACAKPSGGASYDACAGSARAALGASSFLGCGRGRLGCDAVQENLAHHLGELLARRQERREIGAGSGE